MDKVTNEELVAEIQGGASGKMKDLYLKNHGLIYWVAKRYTGRYEIDDLMQTGYLALDRAVKTYDPAQGVKFSTYLIPWLQSYINRQVENTGSVIRIPNYLRQKIHAYKKMVNDFEIHGEKVTDYKLRVMLEVSQEELKVIKKAAMDPVSLSKPVGDPDDKESITLEDTIEDPAASQAIEDAFLSVEHEEFKRDLWGIVDELPEDQKTAIKKRYIQQQTYREMGGKAWRAQQKGVWTLCQSKYKKRLQIYLEDVLSGAFHGVGVGSFNRTWTSATEREALKLCK